MELTKTEGAGDNDIKKPKAGSHRVFPCLEPGCGKTFTKSSNLNQHIRIHSGESPFCCQICNRTFRQSGNLNKHLKSHEIAHLRWNRFTKDKPFKCDKCDKSFTANSSKQNHIKLHCSNKKYASAPDQEKAAVENAPLERAVSGQVQLQEPMAEKFEESSLLQKSLIAWAQKNKKSRFRCTHANCASSFPTQAELRSHLNTPSSEVEHSFLKSSLTKLVSIVDQLRQGNISLRDLPSQLQSIRYDDIRKKLLTAQVSTVPVADALPPATGGQISTTTATAKGLSSAASKTKGSKRVAKTAKPKLAIVTGKATVGASVSMLGVKNETVPTSAAASATATLAGYSLVPPISATASASHISWDMHLCRPVEAMANDKRDRVVSAEASAAGAAAAPTVEPGSSETISTFRQQQIWDFPVDAHQEKKFQQDDNALNFLALIAEQSVADINSKKRKATPFTPQAIASNSSSSVGKAKRVETTVTR